MRYYKKIGAALCCALSLSLPALAANPWQDAYYGQYRYGTCADRRDDGYYDGHCAGGTG